MIRAYIDHITDFKVRDIRADFDNLTDILVAPSCWQPVVRGGVIAPSQIVALGAVGNARVECSGFDLMSFWPFGLGPVGDKRFLADVIIS